MSTIPLGLFCVMLLEAGSPQAPGTAVVHGVVRDARAGSPLAGVTVSVEGQPASMDTDAQGRFVLTVAPGSHAIVATLIGYGITRRTVTVERGQSVQLDLKLAEGAAGYEEHVAVTATASAQHDAGPAAEALHARDLQSLRGVALDDPLRAVQALPSASASDDFFAEFAVRGSTFRHIGTVVDGFPTRHILHTIHGVAEGGSISMLDTDVIGSARLSPGSYPQVYGRRLGAELSMTTRNGGRERRSGRVGLSGTSATLRLEGPLAAGRASYIVSARRSYLDLLLKRIDEDTIAFGFSDVFGKLTFDVSPRQQVQALTVFGSAGFEEQPDGLGVNDEASTGARTWLSGITWRFTPTARWHLTQRVATTGVRFDNRNRENLILDRGRASDLSWRVDALWAPAAALVVEAGTDVQRLRSRLIGRRALNDAPTLSAVSEYDETALAHSGYVQARWRPNQRVVAGPGVRVDRWGLTHTTGTSPWFTTSFALAPGTTIHAGTGLYRQFPDQAHVFGVRAGGRSLRPELAHHTDVTLEQLLDRTVSVRATWWMRRESDVLWTPGAEPRRLGGEWSPARGHARWQNALEGRARGVELAVRRDAATGVTGWIGYAYGRHRYTDRTSGESFWADADQRHALTAYGQLRVTPRASVGAKFRYGSNYPRIGYFRPHTMTDAPMLFGGARPLFVELGETRNEMRLPAYARLDLRADRAFILAPKRLTLFVEVANVLNRRNLRNVPYGVDARGRVSGGTESLLPILPSAGVAIDF